MGTEINDVSSGETSPAVIASPDAAASSAGQESSPDTSASTAGDVTATQGGQDNSGDATQAGSAAPTQDPLEGVPTLEELSQNQSQPYAKALVQLRTAYEALKPQHESLKTLEPWQNIAEKHGDSAHVESLVQIVKGFSTPVEGQTDGDGVPLITAVPGLQRLADTSPDTFFQIIEDGLHRFKVGEETLFDVYGKEWLQKQGISPENLEQHKEWERTGAPVAQSAVDLSNIPDKYQAAFKQLPAVKQRDLAALLASDDADQREVAEYDLIQAQERFERGQAETRNKQAAERQAQVRIEQSTQTAIQGKFESGFNQFLQHLSTWQPTADEKVNRAYHIETASTLVNLLDPNMQFANGMLYETLGMQPDAEIPQLNNQFQQQTGLVELYKARGDKLREAEAQRSADSAYMRLVSRLNGVAAKLVEHKSRVAESSQAAARAGQHGRITVTGQSAALAQNGGRGGDWTKAYYD